MDGTAPIFREATPEDVEQLGPLFLGSLDLSIPGVTFSRDTTLPLDRLLPYIHKRIFPPNALKAYVLELPTGELAGYGSLKPDESGPAQELDMFYIRADLNGRGYGSMLMKAIQNEYKAGGLWLWVFAKNERARRFYEKHGFELIEGKEKVADLRLSTPTEEVMYMMRWAHT